MRDDFRVMHLVLTNRVLDEGAVGAFEDDGYDGIYLKVERDARIADLNFLSRMPGLKYLEVNGRVKDDTAAFKLATLRELVLLTRCRQAIPEIRATNLTALAIDDRPGKERSVQLPNLQSLMVWSWSDLDLAALSGSQALRELHLEGNAQTISLRGIDNCTTLEEVELVELHVDDLRPLSALSDRRRLWIIGTPTASADTLLDLDHLAGLDSLEELRITFGGSVRSLAPLAAMKSLRNVRLRGTRIHDLDEVSLAGLRERATIMLTDD